MTSPAAGRPQDARNSSSFSGSGCEQDLHEAASAARWISVSSAPAGDGEIEHRVELARWKGCPRGALYLDERAVAG